MKLSLIVAEDCAACMKAEFVLRNVILQTKELNFEVVNINNYSGKNIVIVPTLLINEEIFSYGEIDENKLLKILNNSLKDKNELL